MVRRSRAFMATALILAFFAGTIFSPFGVFQYLLLTLLLLILVADSVIRAESEWHPEVRRPVLRSRVAHYVQIAKVKDSARLTRTAGNAFEISLLDRQGWTRLTSQELKELGRNSQAGHNFQTPS